MSNKNSDGWEEVPVANDGWEEVPSSDPSRDASLASNGSGNPVIDFLDWYGRAGASNAVGMLNGVSAGLARPAIKRMTGRDIGEGSILGRVVGTALPAGAAGKMIGGAMRGAPAIARGASILGGEGAISALGSSPEEDFKRYLENAPSDIAGGGISNIVAGGIISGAGKAYNMIPRHAKEFAYREINSLIRPYLKMFNYGKNPGKAIVDSGIVANNIDDLGQKVAQEKQNVWAQVSEKIGNSTAKIDVSKDVHPLDNMIARLKKSPNSNASAIKRAQDARDDLLGIVRDDEGNVVSQRDLTNLTPIQVMEFKQQIGDITKFTGNQTDDNLVNKALKEIYGRAKSKIDSAVKGVSALTEKYAGLLDAGIAIKNSAALAQRKNIVPLAQKIATAGGAVLGVSHGSPGMIAGALTGAGLSMAAEKLAGSTAAKTRFAQWLANKVANAPRATFDGARRGARAITASGAGLLSQ